MAGLLIILAIAAQAAAAEPRQKPKDETTDLKTLQNERIEVLKQLVQVVTKQYQAGLCQFEGVGAAQMELIAAQLDATAEPEKRVALLTQQVEKASELLKLAETRQAGGTVGPADVIRANSLYLDVKIKLLRERSSQRPSTEKTSTH